MATRRRRLPEQKFPLDAEKRHTRDVLAIADALIADIRKAIPALLKPFRDDERADASDPLRIADRKLKAKTKAKGTATKLNRSARVAARFNESQIARQFKTATGRRLTLDPTRERKVVNAFIRQNVKLINGMGTQELAKIRRIIRDGRDRGSSLETMQGQIERRLEVIGSRAKLIASDQLGKLDAALTQSLHKANGADGYTWRTQRDAKVRPIHAGLEGTDHTYDKPPVTNEAGDTNNPGEDVNCRCRAEPKFAA